jgi:hypothetical protein
VAVCVLATVWLVTAGDWDLFAPGGHLETFFDAQAESLLAGRVDVAPEAIGPEAFVRNGKSYGYFGPTPALFRIPLEIVAPGMHGRWSRASMVLASLVAMLAMLMLLRWLEQRMGAVGSGRLRAAMRATAVTAVGLGSTQFYLCAESKVYQEAIAWSAALALAHVVLLVRYFGEPRRKWLAAACATALLAFFARVSVGAGPLVALAIVDSALLIPSAGWRRFWGVEPGGRRAAAAIAVTLGLSAALWMGLNYAKFGSPFSSTPMGMNLQYTRDRLAHMNGGLFAPANLPMNAWSYLLPGHLRFGNRFPWVFLAEGNEEMAKRFPHAHLDVAEPYASLPDSAPALVLGALAGMALCFFRRREELRVCRGPLIGALAGCGLTLAIGFVTYRYLGDWLPWLACASAVAAVSIGTIASNLWRRLAAVAAVTLTAYGVWANFAFAMVQQRVYAFPIPIEKRMVFDDFAETLGRTGLTAAPGFFLQWRKYVGAADFRAGNVKVSLATGRGDQPTIVSLGEPSGAEWTVELPARGRYEVAVRCASAELRPLMLVLNRQLAARNVCGQSTGGWMQDQQLWFPAGVFTLPGERNQVGLATQNAFPAVSVLRFTRVE